MKAKINRENISKHLVEYQLNMVGKTLEDTLSDDMWFFNWTMTPAEHEEFKAYAIPLLKKIFKFNKANAEKTFGWFNLQFGLRIKS
jgi:hypothetical protein